MKTIRWSEAMDAAATCREIVAVLEDGGLACLPCNGRYRIVADLTNTDAVMLLVRSKGRVRKAPALVFIAGEQALDQVAGSVHPLALRLARELWPEPLTIRVKPGETLPGRVRKLLGGSKSRIGVRIPRDPIARAVASEIGRPLLVSSANRERKAGDSSAAQVRKTFAARVDVFLDQGDLQPGPRSTVIDVRKGRVVVARPGAIDEATLERLAAA